MLRVYLNRAGVKTKELERNAAVKFIGGKELGSKILIHGVDPKVDPFSVNGVSAKGRLKELGLEQIGRGTRGPSSNLYY